MDRVGPPVAPQASCRVFFLVPIEVGGEGEKERARTLQANRPIRNRSCDRKAEGKDEH